MTQTDLFPAVPAALFARGITAIASADISPCAREVLRVLLYEPAAGRENAVQIRYIQNLWRVRGQKIFSDRDIKGAVKELLEDQGVPIGSSRSGECGYFLLVDQADVEAAERPILAEVRSLARRLRAINPKSEISRVLCGQMGLES